MSLGSDFTKEVSRLPFCGKHTIKQVSYGAIREKYTYPKIRKSVTGLGFMGFMIVMHGYQAKLGHNAFENDVAWFNAGDTDLLRRSEAAYDVVYAGANAAVTLAQTYIAYRMGKSLISTLRKPFAPEPFEAGIDTDVEFKHSFRTRARRMGKTAMNALRGTSTTQPYEVGINDDIDDITPEDSYPPFQVGIEYPAESPQPTFKEWRQQKADTIPLLVDLAITGTAQAAFIASLYH